MCKTPARSSATMRNISSIQETSLDVAMGLVQINSKLLIRLSNILTDSENTPISGNAVHVCHLYSA